MTEQSEVTTQISRRLADGEVVVIDGGMLIELLNRGLLPPAEPTKKGAARGNATACVDAPEAVRGLHREYIDAGADVIFTATFASGPSDLEALGLGDRVEEFNRAAVKLAVDARADANAQNVAVGGSIPCNANGLAVRAGTFKRHAEALADAGVDLIAVELVLTLADGTEAIEAVHAVGLPVWVGVSATRSEGGEFVTGDSAVRWDRRGESLREDIAAFAAMGIDALTIMHTEIDDVEEALAIAREEFNGPIGAYPHHGTSTDDWREWHMQVVEPRDFASAAVRWVDAGAQIIGGCCGIGPAHIAATKAALDRRSDPAIR